MVQAARRAKSREGGRKGGRLFGSSAERGLVWTGHESAARGVLRAAADWTRDYTGARVERAGGAGGLEVTRFITLCIAEL